MIKGIYLEKLKEEYREQFILDNQYAFKYGAITELKDNELDIDGEIISRETINSSIDSNSFRYNNSDFNKPKKFSITELSKQLPFLDILC